jgi:outer membrane receptor protein involved in Fe transport
MHRWMRYVAAAVSLLSAQLGSAGSLPGQGRTADVGNRPVQFLAARWPKPVPVDVRRTPALRQRVALDLRGMTLVQALETIADSSGLRFAYSRSEVPVERLVRLQAHDITVAAALTEVLLGLEVDIVLGDRGQAMLVKRRSMDRPANGTIVGRATDGQTGHPLPGVAVSLQGSQLGATTGDDGRYRIADVAPGSYTLVARRIGYLPVTQPVSVMADQTTTVDIALSAHVPVMDELVVASTLVESRRRELSAPVGVLQEESIRTPSRTRIDQLFRGDVPGIIGIEGHPAQSGAYLFVRGRASLDLANLVKVYVDGVEVPSTTYLASLDLQNVERVELLRGPQASTIYGSNASGGVLLIFTKEGAAGGPWLSGKASAGTTASDFIDDTPLTMEHRLNLSGGDKGFGYSLGGSFNSAGAYIEQADARQVALNGRGTFTQGPFRFSLTSMYTHNVVGLTVGPVAPVLAPAIPEWGVLQNTDVTANTSILGASATYAPSGRWTTTLNLGWSQVTNRSDEYEPKRAIGDTTYTTSLDSYDQINARLYSTVQLEPSASVRSTTTAGVDLSRSGAEYYEAYLTDHAASFQPTVGTSFITPRQITTNQGYFLQQVLGHRDRLFLTGAVRLELNSNFGANEDWIWAPRIGVSYLIDLGSNAALKPRASYGKSVRPPQPGQEAGSVSATSVQLPNPNLRPEVQRGFDAGFDLHVGQGELSLEVTYFNQIADDLIDGVYLTFVPVAQLQYQNVGEVKSQGLELGVSSRLGLVDLTASYSYAKSTVRSLSSNYGGDLEVGDQLIYVPQHTAGGTLGLNLSSLWTRRPVRGTRLEIGATYVGERRTEDQVGFYSCLFGLSDCVDDTFSVRDYWATLPGFVKFRVAVTQPLGEKLVGFVNVDNIANKQDSELLALYPSRGRALLVGLRFGE